MSQPQPGEPQWLREDEPPDDLFDPPEPSDWGAAPTSGEGRATPAVWVLAVVLAVVAPFFAVTDVRFSGLHETSNGWGHIDVQNEGPLQVVSDVGHSTRGGVLFAVAALVLVVAVLAWISRSRRVAGVFGLIGSIGVVASAGFVGLTAEAVSSVSSRDNVTSLGAGVWLSVAAGVVALVGAFLAARELLHDA